MSGGPHSQVSRDEAIAHMGNFWVCGFCPAPPAPWPWPMAAFPPRPHTHTSSQMEMPKSCSPAVLVDHPCLEAHLVQRHLQGPVSPPRPGAPAAPAGPGGTQEAFEGFWGGKGGGWEEARLWVTHLDPPPSGCPGLALLSLWSLKNQGAPDGGCLEVQNPRSSGSRALRGSWAQPLHLLDLSI